MGGNKIFRYNPFYVKINGAAFPERLFKNAIRTGKMNYHHRRVTFFGNTESAVTKFLKLAGFGNPSFGINSYGADAVFQKFRGFVYCFKGFAVIFSVKGKTGGFIKVFVGNGVTVIFLAAYECYVISPQKYNGNSRVKPGNVVAHKKKFAVFRNIVTTGHFNVNLHYFQKKYGRFCKNSVKKAVLSVNGLVKINKEREKYTNYNVSKYTYIKYQKSTKRYRPRPKPISYKALHGCSGKRYKKPYCKIEIIQHIFTLKNILHI